MQTWNKTLQHWKATYLPRLVLLLMLLFHNGSWLLAQQPAGTDGGDPTPGATIQPPSRSLVLEIIIILLFTGAALFAICKSSRRT